MASRGKRSRSSECRVALAADLVIADATRLHVQLGEALARPEPVVLDAAAVARLDTAGLQLLLAFVQARDEALAKWHWENVGAALRDCAGQVGLEKMLQLPDAVPAND
jgi:phospholipid transport system transporter-binding protein